MEKKKIPSKWKEINFPKIPLWVQWNFFLPSFLFSFFLFLLPLSHPDFPSDCSSFLFNLFCQNPLSRFALSTPSIVRLPLNFQHESTWQYLFISTVMFQHHEILATISLCFLSIFVTVLFSHTLHSVRENYISIVVHFNVTGTFFFASILKSHVH